MEKIAQVIILLIVVIFIEWGFSKKFRSSLTEEERKLNSKELINLWKAGKLSVGKKTLWIWALCFVLIVAPLIEELIFRAPLLVGFSNFTVWTWLAIVGSAGVFGWLHYDSKILRKWQAFISRKKIEELPDPQFYGAKGIIRGIQVFLLGIFLGWLTISTQNIFWSVIAHIGFNLWGIMGGWLIVFLPIIGIVIGITAGVSFLKDKCALIKSKLERRCKNANNLDE